MSYAEDPLFMAKLAEHEGVRLKPYRDTVGKLTIGIGRNLDDVGITRDEAYYLASNNVADCERTLDNHIPWWREMSIPRQRVLVDICFNMGWVTLSTFINTLGAMQRGDYPAAAAGMRASKWARQVGQRAVFLSRVMETGEGQEAA